MGTSPWVSVLPAPAEVATTSWAVGKRPRIAAPKRLTNARNDGAMVSGSGSKSMLAPSAERWAMRSRAWLMNRFWAVVLLRNAVIFRSEPESKSWNVGTTRTPAAWAAFVTATALSLTYAAYPRHAVSMFPLVLMPSPKNAIVERRSYWSWPAIWLSRRQYGR